MNDVSGAGDTKEPPEDDGETPEAAVERRLETALERVAHGAVVSVPSIIIERALTVAFTAVLTNGFAAGPYGLFALARRLQQFPARLALGFRSGLSRYLPNADSEAERDAVATFAALLLLGVAAVFGLLLLAATPTIAAWTGKGPRFRLYLQVFAIGMPATVWLWTVTELLRGLEEVGPLNATVRIGFPAMQLGVGLVGAFVSEDLAVVAVGVVGSMGLSGTLAAVWLARERGLRPRVTGPGVPALRRRYLSFTLPLFLGGFATVVQRLGFYPLIAVFLSGTAAGVFTVGTLLGLVVRLPLMGVNQFTPPVAAALHEDNQREALKRLYHVTSRLVLVGVTGLAVPLVVYRRPVMALFGRTFRGYAPLLPWFVLAQAVACAAGSVGILLAMTDNQRALLIVNTAITVVLAAVAIPLTARFGLPGVVATFVLMLSINNALEVAVLYYLEGLQPLTAAHAKPVVAAVPLAAVALVVRSVPVPVAPVVGTALGLAAYAGALLVLGFDPVERRLLATLATRYRTALASLTAR